MSTLLLLVLSGYPAVGKSTFATWLANNHGFHWIDVEHDLPNEYPNVVQAWRHLPTSATA